MLASPPVTSSPSLELNLDLDTIASRYGWSDEEARARKSICEIGKICYQRNLISAADGNISVRLADDSVIITAAGSMKGFLSMEQLTRVDMTGKVISGPGQNSTETGIHLVCYHERPDIRAVLHCHPPHAVALSVAEIDMQMPIIPEMIVTIGGIPTTPFATPGTSELGESIREVVRCSDTLVMRNHGSVTVGSNLLDAFKKLDMLEHTARILWLAHTVKGGLEPLPEAAVRKLLDTRAQLGLAGRNTLENRCGLPNR
jgi:L-fuculose-phosphate aldolase